MLLHIGPITHTYCVCKPFRRPWEKSSIQMSSVTMPERTTVSIDFPASDSKTPLHHSPSMKVNRENECISLHIYRQSPFNLDL